jgi:hypothetical protein
MKYSILVFFLFLSFLSFSQDSTSVEKKHQKGKIYFYWGWNRAGFTNSDIQFTGPGHDFTLYDVVAYDRQTPFSLDPYFNPALITIPQTNVRIGYFISDHYEVSIGVDHMKYVVSQNQTVAMDGVIEIPENPFNGVYVNDSIQLSEDFLTFEHTDGLNYINFEFNRWDNLVQFNRFSKVNIDLNMLGGLGAGMMMPKSNVMLFGQDRNDQFHVAGFGLSAKLGLNLTIYDYFFIQSELKGGYIYMSDILTRADHAYTASQDFFFLQVNFVLGAIIPLTHPHKDKK